MYLQTSSALAESKQAGMVSTPQGTVALVESERIEVQQVGTTVIINGIYNRTNHYIRQSRDFVGGAKLTCYVNFPALISLSVVAMLVSLASPVHYIMAGIDVIWLGIFIQHMYVNVKTMPHMLKLPRMPNHMHRSNNGFFEINIEKYRAAFAEQEEAGIGIVLKAKGTVKLHILTYKAVGYIKSVMFYSTVALIAFFFLIFYSFIFGIVGAVLGGGLVFRSS